VTEGKVLTAKSSTQSTPTKTDVLFSSTGAKHILPLGMFEAATRNGRRVQVDMKKYDRGGTSTASNRSSPQFGDAEAFHTSMFGLAGHSAAGQISRAAHAHLEPPGCARGATDIAAEDVTEIEGHLACLVRWRSS